MRVDAMRWSGDPADEQRLVPLLRRADRPGSRSIWWLEPDFAGRADLLVTREAATGAPLRVRSGDVLRLSGSEFSATRGAQLATPTSEGK
jgi:hypothetical protein